MEQQLYKNAKEIVYKLKTKGHIAYFAGGFVRDFLMQRVFTDIDIATSASVEEITALFPKCVFVGVQFGVVQVIKHKMHFEVATFRKDIGSKDGRYPESIETADAIEDAKRRDFTINGMFYDPLEEKVLDFVGGQKDIEEKCIRAIGNPVRRIEEDRLRMIRAIRFAVRFDFWIEEETKKAIKKFAPTLFPAVSIERVVDELRKMGAHKSFIKALLMLDELKLLPVIFPKNNLKIAKAPIACLPADTPLVLKLVHLFLDLDKDVIKIIFLDLKLSSKQLELVDLFLECDINGNDFLLVKWLARPFGYEALLSKCATLPHSFKDRLVQKQKELAPYIKMAKTNTFFIKAKDFLALGMEKGPLLGKALERAFEIAVVERLANKEAVLSRTEWKNLLDPKGQKS
jgi:poly(A) polymerase